LACSSDRGFFELSLCHGVSLSGFAFFQAAPYLWAMPSPQKKIRPKKATAAKMRSWRVAILRNRSYYLGDVRAPDEKAAEAAAASEFNLSDEQRNRIVMQERD